METPWRQIGRYQIDHQIGVGGMALTFRGKLGGVGGFEKLVVIKLIHPSHAGDTSFLDMFLDEARLTARLTHPNIAQIFEIDVHQGLPYIVMELVSGPNLSQVQRKLGTPTAADYGPIARLMAGVARALSHAHQLTDDEGKPLHIIHRDVSLGNIVVAPTGTAKLIDFGIARWANRNHMTEVGVLKGKTQYLAPEQMAGKTDQRVDIYQLGVCLYWLCAGVPPYGGDNTLAIWTAQMEGKLRPITEVVPTFPPGLAAVIAKAMATHVEDRYQTAADLAEALSALAQSDPALQATDEDVVSWLHRLFPDTEWGSWNQRLREPASGSLSGLSRPNLPIEAGSYSSATGSRPLTAPITGGQPRPQGTQSTQTQTQAIPAPTPAQRWGRLAGGAAFIALTALLALSLTQEPEAPPPEALTAAEPGPEVRAAALLDQAEAALSVPDLALARSLIEQAKTGAMASPEVEIRYLRDLKTLEYQETLAKGRAALAEGRYDEARLIARTLLDVNVEDAAARAILDGVVAATRPPPPPPSPSARAERSQPELVTVVINGPVGASVDVDDVNVGLVPATTRVTPGVHRIAVRKAGFITFEESSNFRGKSTTITAVLDPKPPEPQAVVATPTPPPPAPEPTPLPVVPPPTPEELAAAQPPELPPAPTTGPTAEPATQVDRTRTPGQGSTASTSRTNQATPNFAAMADPSDAGSTPTRSASAPAAVSVRPPVARGAKRAPSPATPAPAPVASPTTPTPSPDLRPAIGGARPTEAVSATAAAPNFAAVPDAAPTTPTTQPTAAAPSKLPANIDAISLGDLAKVLSRVEADAIARGAPPDKVKGVTRELYAKWTSHHPSPSVYQMPAAAMSNLIVSRAASSKRDISSALVTTYGPR
jgi:serine/threonine-protein kinase